MHNIQHHNVREMESMAEIEFLKITLSRYLRLNFLPENRNKIQIDIKVHTSGSSLIQCISEIQYFLHNFFQFGAAPDLKMRRKRNYSNNYEWLKKKKIFYHNPLLPLHKQSVRFSSSFWNQQLERWIESWIGIPSI